jgi:hypothetical protein
VLGGGGLDILQLPFTRAGITEVGFFGSDGVILRAPGAEVMFSSIEALEFSDQRVPYSDFALQQKKTPVITSTGYQFNLALHSSYMGPVGYLQYQHVNSYSNATIYGTKASEFLKASGTGNKAINGGGGSDVIDGGVGSNFLTGGGTPNDKVTYYLDGRANGESWSTITDFHLSSDFITIWGWRPGVSGVKIDEITFNNSGAKGYEGLTIRFMNLLPDSAPNTATNSFLNSITLTGYTLEQLGAKTLQELALQISTGQSRFFQVGIVEGQGYLQIGTFAAMSTPSSYRGQDTPSRLKKKLVDGYHIENKEVKSSEVAADMRINLIGVTDIGHTEQFVW